MKNIWDLALDVGKSYEISLPKESTIVVLGSKEGGKSSLIYRFLERSDVPKSSLALEYMFARKQSNQGRGKDICNLWELGGGTLFTNLLEFAIYPENIQNLSLVIIVDLSLPEKIILTLETLLEQAKEKVDLICKQESNNFAEIFKEGASARIGSSHEDASLIAPFNLPLLIIGTKYDLFQEFDSEKRKQISRYLRLTAHLNGASLYYVTIKSETLINRVRIVLGRLAFGTNSQELTPVYDHNKPLVIPFGSDTFKLIGFSSLEAVQEALVENCPQVANNVIIPDNPGNDPNFKERDIDLVRAQKSYTNKT